MPGSVSANVFATGIFSDLDRAVSLVLEQEKSSATKVADKGKRKRAFMDLDYGF